MVRSDVLHLLTAGFIKDTIFRALRTKICQAGTAFVRHPVIINSFSPSKPYNREPLSSLCFFFKFFQVMINRLLENLAVGHLVLLAVDGGRLLPTPNILDKLAVFRLARVELGELVALVVGSDIESGDVFLATDDKGTLDDGVVVLTVNGGTSEDELARSLKAGVEATNQVVGHEGEGELVIVLVVDLPDGVFLEVDVLPEPLHGLGGFVVGVVALPLIERKRCLGEEFKRMLRPGGSGWLLSSGSGNLLLGGGLLGLLGLLRGSVGEGRGLEELNLLSNLREDGLVADGIKPASDGGVLAAELLVEEELEATLSDASSKDISKGDALADEVGVAAEVALNNGEGLQGSLGGIIDVLLVVRGVTSEGAEPLTEAA